MIHLPNVTLVSVNCTNPPAALKALRYSMRGIKFEEAILFTHQHIPTPEGIRCRPCDHLTSWNMYNDYILKLGEKVNTDYVLIVQDDGFVVSPHLWDPAWLQYDYIGAPWPNEESWIDKQTLRGAINATFPRNRVGNGGFSLRSRKFLEQSAKYATCEGYGEDAYLCTLKYEEMIAAGIKFAPLDVAYKFSIENPIVGKWDSRAEMDITAHFGFHGRQLGNSEMLINLKDTI